MKRFLPTIIALLLLYQGMMAQTTYPAFYNAPKESYVKSMKTVFEDIHSRKWDKAQRDYSKVEEKSALAQQKFPAYTNTQMQALYPLPQVAMAIILSTERPAPAANSTLTPLPLDYDKAYSLLKLALSYPEKDKLNSFLQDPGINVNLSMLEDRIETELCKKATATNTEKAYDSVIDSLMPQSLRLLDMMTQRENLVFSAITKAPTEEECQRFLTKYTDAQVAHKTRITHTLDSLRYASLDGSITSLEKYIKQYPNSSYTTKAKETLEELEYQKIGQSAASCRRFMEKYPSSKYTLEVKKRLYDYAYKEALATGTSEAYLAYCKEFPYELHYQNVFDTLLTRTVTKIYDTVFAGHEPDKSRYLSATFLESVQKREAAEKQLIEHDLIPPRRRNMWTGTMQGLDAKVFSSLEITEIDIKSKTMASVHIHLSAAASETDEVAKKSTEETKEPVAVPQMDAYLDFIFEDSSLKLDDIRLDDGKSSQKQSNLGYQ